MNTSYYWWMEYHHYDTEVVIRVESAVYTGDLFFTDFGKDGKRERGHLRARIIALFRLMTDRPRLTWGDMIEAGEFNGGLEFLD